MLPLAATSCTPPKPQGNVVFQDDFSDPNSGWAIINAGENLGGTYVPGGFTVWAKFLNEPFLVNPKLLQPFSNFTVEADVRSVPMTTGSVATIIYRADNAGNFYNFGISDNQSYFISKSVKGSENYIYTPAHSEFIKTGSETNRMKVVCSGPTQEFYVNDNMLATIKDDTSPKGVICMSFAFGDSSDNFTVTGLKVTTMP